MLKKYTQIIIALLMVFCLAGCECEKMLDIWTDG